MVHVPLSPSSSSLPALNSITIPTPQFTHTDVDTTSAYCSSHCCQTLTRLCVASCLSGSHPRGASCLSGSRPRGPPPTRSPAASSEAGGRGSFSPASRHVCMFCCSLLHRHLRVLDSIRIIFLYTDTLLTSCAVLSFTSLSYIWNRNLEWWREGCNYHSTVIPTWFQIKTCRRLEDKPMTKRKQIESLDWNNRKSSKSDIITLKSHKSSLTFHTFTLGEKLRKRYTESESQDQQNLSLMHRTKPFHSWDGRRSGGGHGEGTSLNSASDVALREPRGQEMLFYWCAERRNRPRQRRGRITGCYIHQSVFLITAGSLRETEDPPADHLRSGINITSSALICQLCNRSAGVFMSVPLTLHLHSEF